MSTRVKICGITNLADALAAVAAGADALGFNFYEGSPRHVSLKTAAEISKQLPPFVMRAGVFVNADEDLVTRAIGECGLGLLQFHGDEPPEFCAQFGLMSMKAFRIRDVESLKELPEVPDRRLFAGCLFAGSARWHGREIQLGPGKRSAKVRQAGFSRRRIDAGKRRRCRANRPAVRRGRCQRRGKFAGQEGSRENPGVHCGGAGGVKNLTKEICSLSPYSAAV